MGSSTGAAAVDGDTNERGRVIDKLEIEIDQLKARVEELIDWKKLQREEILSAQVEAWREAAEEWEDLEDRLFPRIDESIVTPKVAELMEAARALEKAAEAASETEGREA